jgi:hypothetical protein
MQAKHPTAGFESGQKASDSGNVSEPKELKLPDIALSDLPESTKDFLIAYSATGKTVPEAIKETLNQAASAAGFAPNPKAA